MTFAAIVTHEIRRRIIAKSKTKESDSLLRRKNHQSFTDFETYSITKKILLRKFAIHLLMKKSNK